MDRYSRSEIKYVTTINVKDLNKEIDLYAKKLRKLEKQGKFREFSPHNRLQEALDNGWINQEEFALVTDARKQKRDVIMVDDFDMKLKNYDKNLLDRVVF